MRGQERYILWHSNPSRMLHAAWFSAVDLYRHSLGGMGRGWLPEAGGMNQQPAWLVKAFGVIAAEEARIEEAKGGG